MGCTRSLACPSSHRDCHRVIAPTIYSIISSLLPYNTLYIIVAAIIVTVSVGARLVTASAADWFEDRRWLLPF